jgi:uncharacterized protein YciI
MHALVLMAPGPAQDRAGELEQAHERFVDELVDPSRAVLGGSWKPSAGGFDAAYLVSCESLEEAREIALSDPFARAGAIRCEVVEWELVGVNADAIDQSSLLFPR